MSHFVEIKIHFMTCPTLSFKGEKMNYIKKLKIGNVELPNNLILAPMAGVTNRPFRIICKKYGAGMVCTEMASSRAMFHNDLKTKRFI